MRRFVVSAAFSFAILPTFNDACFSLEAAIIAPIGCVGSDASCDTDITLSDALKRANARWDGVSACLEKEKINKEKKERVENGALEKLKQRNDDIANHLKQDPNWMPPVIGPPEPSTPDFFSQVELPEPCLFNSATEDDICQSRESKSYGWMNIDSTFEGSGALASLVEKLKNGKVFGGGRVLLEASESLKNEQHIALCDVQTVNGSSGPPSNCSTVAIVTPNHVLLREGYDRADSRVKNCATASFITLGGGIQIEFHVQTSDDLSAIANAIVSALTSLGFGASSIVQKSSDHNIGSFSVLASLGMRTSKILGQDWSESMDFNFYGSQKENAIDIIGTATPMVSRRPDANSVSYHGLTDAQKTTYSNYLNATVKTALSGACTTLLSADDRNITCK